MSWNPITWVKTEAPIVETDVLTFIKNVELGFQTAITDAEKALSWVASQTPAIASDLQMVTSFIGAVPVVAGNPEVLAAVTAANLAVQGLNAFASSYTQATTGGGITASAAAKAVVSGYQAVKAAQSAAAAVASKAVGSTTSAAA